MLGVAKHVGAFLDDATAQNVSGSNFIIKNERWGCFEDYILSRILLEVMKSNEKFGTISVGFVSPDGSSQILKPWFVFETFLWVHEFKDKKNQLYSFPIAFCVPVTLQ